MNSVFLSPTHGVKTHSVMTDLLYVPLQHSLFRENPIPFHSYLENIYTWICNLRYTCSSVKVEVLVPTHLHRWLSMLFKNKFCSFRMEMIHRKVSSYNSDKLIIADIHFVYIFELISISTQLWNDRELIYRYWRYFPLNVLFQMLTKNRHNKKLMFI